MSAIRRFLTLSVLVAAFVLGQGAVLLHGLGHAFDRVQVSHDWHHGGDPDTCDQCFKFAQLSGSAPAFVTAPPQQAPRFERPLFSSTPAQSRTVVATRSRAPPASA
jgi:hypothetical protein